jgi:hypothetical protein
MLEGKAPGELLERMDRYIHEVYEHGHGDKSGLSEACEAVIAAVQGELALLEPGPVDSFVAFELVTMELWALHAIVDQAGHGAAKREQVRLSGGRPLAICRQTASIRVVQTSLGPIKVNGEGCFRIFESPTRASGRMWPHLCPDCRPRNGKRQPLRDAERALRTRVRTVQAMYPFEDSLGL